jgi:hypothetical protein
MKLMLLYFQHIHIDLPLNSPDGVFVILGSWTYIPLHFKYIPWLYPCYCRLNRRKVPFINHPKFLVWLLIPLRERERWI